MKNHIDVRKLTFYVVPKKLKEAQLSVDEDQVVTGLSNFLKGKIDKIKSGDLAKGHVYVYGSDSSLAYVGAINISADDNDKVSYEWTKQEELPNDFSPYGEDGSSETSDDESNKGDETNEEETDSSEETGETTGNADGEGDNGSDTNDTSDEEESTNKSKSKSKKKTKEDESSDDETSDDVENVEDTSETDDGGDEEKDTKSKGSGKKDEEPSDETDAGEEEKKDSKSKGDKKDSAEEEQNVEESALIVESFLDYYAEQALRCSDSKVYEYIYEESAILASLYLEGLVEDMSADKPVQITKDKYLDAKKNWDEARYDSTDNVESNPLSSSAVSLKKAETEYNDSDIQINQELLDYKKDRDADRLGEKSKKTLVQALNTDGFEDNTPHKLVEDLCVNMESSMITYEADCEKLIEEGVIDETIFENSTYLLSGFVCNAFGRTLEHPDWYVKENAVSIFLEEQLPDMLKPYSDSFLKDFKREELPDTAFGVPSQRKFPLVDKNHVETAIKLFHEVDPEYEEELANNIITKMREYDMFGKCKIHNKSFEKYLVKKDDELKDTFDITGFPVATEFNVAAMLPTHGLAFYNRQRPLKDFHDGIDSTPEFEKLEKKALNYIKSKYNIDGGLCESVMDEELGVMYEAVDKKAINEMKKELSKFESLNKGVTPFKRLRKRKVTPKPDEVKQEINNVKFTKCVDYIDNATGYKVMRCYYFDTAKKAKVAYKIITSPAKGKITASVLRYYSDSLELSIDKENINMNKAKSLASINGNVIAESVGFVTEAKLIEKIKQDIGYSKVIKAYEKENPGITKLKSMTKTHVMDNGEIYENIDKSIADKVKSVIKSSGIKNIDDAWVYRYKTGKLFALALNANPNDKLITRIFFIENIPAPLQLYYKAVFYNKTDSIPNEVVKWKENYAKKLKAVKESVANHYHEASMDITLESMMMNNIKFDGVLRLFEDLHPDIIRYSSLIPSNIPVSELDKYEDVIRPEIRRVASNANKYSYAGKDYLVQVFIKGHQDPRYYFIGDIKDKDKKMYYLAASYNNNQSVPEELVKWRMAITAGAEGLTNESADLYELFESGILKNINVPVSGNYEDFVDVYYRESITDIEASSVLYDNIQYCKTESVDIDKPFIHTINDIESAISNQFDKYCESASFINKMNKVYTMKLSDDSSNLKELVNKFEDMGFNTTDYTTNCVAFERIKGDRIYRAYIDTDNKKITVTLDKMNVYTNADAGNDNAYKDLEDIKIKSDDKIMCMESSYIDPDSDNLLKNYYYTLENSDVNNLYKLSVPAYNHLTDKQKEMLESTFTRVNQIEQVFTERYATERKLINDSRKLVSKIKTEHLNYRKYYNSIMSAVDKLERSGEKSVGTKNKIKLTVIKNDAEDTFEKINTILGNKSIDVYKREIEMNLKNNKRTKDIKSSVANMRDFKKVVKLSEKLFNYDEKCSEYLKYLNKINVKQVNETVEDTGKVFDIILPYTDEYGVTYESYDKYRHMEAYSAYLENEELFNESIKDKIVDYAKGFGKGVKDTAKTVGSAAVNAIKATGQYIKNGNTMLYFITGKDDDGNEIVGKCTLAEYNSMNPKAKRRIDSYKKIDKYRYKKIKSEISKRRKDDKRRIKHSDKLSKIDKSKHNVKIAYESKGVDTSDVDLKYDEKDRQRLVNNITKININKLVANCKKLEDEYNDLRSQGIKIKDLNIKKIKRAVKMINKKYGKSPIIFVNHMKTDMPIKNLAKFEKIVVDTQHTLEEYNKKLGYVKINYRKDIKDEAKKKVIADNAKIIKEYVEDYGIEDFDYIIESKKDIDDDIRPLIDKLNAKGYKTKASCSGHENTRIKEDTYRDGEYKGKLYTTARVIFDGKYDLPNAPKLWETRDAGGNSAIYVKQKHLNDSEGAPNDAFDSWKVLYMNSLKKWVDRLPDISKK